MTPVLHVPAPSGTAVADRLWDSTAAGTAAVTAAEAIAAKVAADLAAEGAARAAHAVVAACAAAARAAGNASSTAAAAVSAAAAAAETAMQNALDEEGDCDSATATAVASVALSLALTDGPEGAAEGAVTSWDETTSAAVLTSAAAAAMAAAHVAVTISAAAAAAATAAIDAALLLEGQLPAGAHEHLAAADGIRQAIAAHAAGIAGAVRQVAAEPGQHLPEARHPEWASMLADPVLPAFLTDAGDADHAGDADDAVTAAPPAERGLLRDLSLAQRVVSAVRHDEAEFAAAFRAAPAGLLLLRVAVGRPPEVVQANAAVSALTGHPAVELLGDGYLRLTPAGPGLPAPRLGSAGAPGRTGGRVERWVHADGSEILVRIRTASTSTSHGSVQHLVCHVDRATEA